MGCKLIDGRVKIKPPGIGQRFRSRLHLPGHALLGGYPILETSTPN